MTKRIDEHSFSVEMNSEHCVRRISFLDEEKRGVFFEGFLGELKNIAMVEELMLEITGANGILRVDISRKEMEKCLTVKKSKQCGDEEQ